MRKFLYDVSYIYLFIYERMIYAYDNTYITREREQYSYILNILRKNKKKYFFIFCFLKKRFYILSHFPLF